MKCVCIITWHNLKLKQFKIELKILSVKNSNILNDKRSIKIYYPSNKKDNTFFNHKPI